MSVWLFGYGSLIWRPEFSYLEARPARLQGYARRFWQGSHDHRGLPDAPGRVVTLVADPGSHCEGMAYRIDADTADSVLTALDYREKNGYQRLQLSLRLLDRHQQEVSALVYLATPENFAFLGPAPTAQIAGQIHRSCGPSGHNRDYLFDLARVLRDLSICDPHVFELEAAVRALDHQGEPFGHRLQP
ncbi:MAG: gamma-glutamylcyclotransferase [Pseudomonadales bacterium]